MASPSKQLSTEGQALVADFRDVVQQAQLLLLSKNEGNLLQDFIWQSQHVDGGSAGKPGAPLGKDQAKQHGSEALDGLRTLGTLLISNGQFRKLCTWQTSCFNISHANILTSERRGRPPPRHWC